MPADESVTRVSFSGRLHPIFDPRPLPLLPARVWSEKDWQRVQLGYRSQGMDEKWDVITEGDVVFLHRSWTGHGIFEATFAPADGGGRIIAEAVAETDRDRYRSPGDEYDCLMLELVLSTIVLGEPARELRSAWVQLARKAAGSADAPGGLLQHSVLGSRSGL